MNMLVEEYIEILQALQTNVVCQYTAERFEEIIKLGNQIAELKPAIKNDIEFINSILSYQKNKFNSIIERFKNEYITRDYIVCNKGKNRGKVKNFSNLEKEMQEEKKRSSLRKVLLEQYMDDMSEHFEAIKSVINNLKKLKD